MSLKLNNEISTGSLANIVIVIGGIVAVALYVAKMETAQVRDAAAQQVRIEQLEARVNRTDAAVSSQVREIKDETAKRLDRIEGKLDRLISDARASR
jgi:hypothetical protein